MLVDPPPHLLPPIGSELAQEKKFRTKKKLKKVADQAHPHVGVQSGFSVFGSTFVRNCGKAPKAVSKRPVGNASTTTEWKGFRHASEKGEPVDQFIHTSKGWDISMLTMFSGGK